MYTYEYIFCVVQRLKFNIVLVFHAGRKAKKISEYAMALWMNDKWRRKIFTFMRKIRKI